MRVFQSNIARHNYPNRAHAENAIGHMVERREGKQALEIGLSQCEERAPQDRHQREGHQRTGVLLQLLRENGNDESQETVHAHFRHHAGEQHGHRCRRGGVRWRLPDVKRRERHLHPQSGEDSAEDQRADANVFFGEFDEVKGAGLLVQKQEAQQHRHATQHGKQKKIQRCTVPFLAFAEELDEKEGWHQRQFPIQEPMEKVQRSEGAKQAGEQETEQHEIGARPVGVLPRSQHNERREQRRQQQHQRVGAVQAHEVRHHCFVLLFRCRRLISVKL